MAMLLSGGSVFDGDGNVLADHGVLIEDDRITRVAPASEFSDFKGQRVDTSGGTVLPGLFDCHVHLCMTASGDTGADMAKMSDAAITMLALQNAQTILRGGVTSVRDCGGKDYLEFAVRDALNARKFMGPTIHAVGKMICMTGGHGNRIGRIADGVQEVVKAVREQIHAGCDCIKIMATGGVGTPGVNPEDAHYTAEEMASGIHEAHRFHKHTASHAQGRDGILNAVRGGIDSIEHGIFMDDRCVSEMKENGTWLVPTLAAPRHILENGDAVPDYVIQKTTRVSKHHLASIKMYAEAGGKMAMGTDTGTPFNVHGTNAMELAYMVEAGVAPLVALQAATGNAADLVRDPERGRIKEGLYADILIVNGDPTSDINMVADKSNHRAVLKYGELAAGSLG
ncbi:MAG: amidohydrolase family protein [Alphaproteobacteria bacterium]|jgi:imidazolonepropionase-like amidohydrolase|nr:amidohydrolase family protein [Alphaproteobacteria bacterium]MBT4086069.1 amidohydrolase family protein [Alphaproteobacteria bacterium]MBT4543686.1 amidohydrolase family protein [Alphaproteobacteria bacterium]MBT7743931.1 amidohydrolase family protein [Alphaproteobacteria bacterium]